MRCKSLYWRRKDIGVTSTYKNKEVTDIVRSLLSKVLILLRIGHLLTDYGDLTAGLIPSPSASAPHAYPLER